MMWAKRFLCFFFFSSRRRHTRSLRDWSSDVCSSDLIETSRQFSREQDIGQLGFAVAAKAPIGALGVEIVERDVRSLKDYKKDTGKDLRKVAKAKDVAHRMLEAGSAVVTLASCQIRIVRGHREPRRNYRIATKIGR